MSRHGSLLPADPAYLAEAVDAWNQGVYQGYPWPRSLWLRDVEIGLAAAFPQASSADRRLTARHAAPFPLRDGPNVP